MHAASLRSSHGSRFFLAVVASVAVSLLARADAPTPAKDKPLPEVFSKTVPTEVKELKAIQDHVQKLLPKLQECTVGVRIGQRQGSGVIVSKDGYVLTAGHVSGAADATAEIILPNGKRLKAKTLGANKGIDSGMIKIIEEGEYPFAQIARSGDLKKGFWCIAIGHPGGYQKGRTPVVRVGRVLDTNKSIVRTDCALVGGDSGGPLFDMQGRVIGIHSRIGNTMTANVHVPVDTFHETWDKLAQGEVWGTSILGGGPPNKDGNAYLGLKFDPEAKSCKIEEVMTDSPAKKAGLKANDVITMIDNLKVASSDDLIKALRSRRPGNEIAVQVLRNDETVKLKVTLGKWPG